MSHDWWLTPQAKPTPPTELSLPLSFSGNMYMRERGKCLCWRCTVSASQKPGCRQLKCSYSPQSSQISQHFTTSCVLKSPTRHTLTTEELCSQAKHLTSASVSKHTFSNCTPSAAQWRVQTSLIPQALASHSHASLDSNLSWTNLELSQLLMSRGLLLYEKGKRFHKHIESGVCYNVH